MILGPNDPRALHLSAERKQILRENFLAGLDTVTQTCHNDITHNHEPEEAPMPDNQNINGEIAEVHVLADGSRGGWIVQILHTDDEGDWQTAEYHFDHLQYVADLVRSLGDAA